jgi:SAM-dependent methyltransferase
MALARGCWIIYPTNRSSTSWSFVAAVIPPYAVATSFEIKCNGATVESNLAALPAFFQDVMARLDLTDASSLVVEFTVHPGNDSATLSCLTKRGERIGTDYYVSAKPSQSQIGGTSAMRVIRTDNENYYHFTGYDEAQKIHNFISQHYLSTGSASLKVLDWGVGSGRVTQYLQNFPNIEMFGTDIDPVNMASLHAAGLPKSNFRLTQPGGEIPFDDKTFDAIFGISVFTHLTEEMQFYYLAEIRRVLKPNGIGIFSVHGLPHFFTRINDGHTLLALTEHGIKVTGSNNDLVQGFAASKQLYVNTLHAPEYILRSWSPYFSTVSITQAPLVNTHDLVICSGHPAEQAGTGIA